MRYSLRTLLIVLAVGPPTIWLVVGLALCVWVIATEGSWGLRLYYAILNP
ncbi:MAG: hypothetical protein L0211_21390 [Planctomycetaceae bacterium]|nr:hypothetical protein [Planctomycetaceae bacterium]